jgi:ABC-2 type transport system permease protein
MSSNVTERPDEKRGDWRPAREAAPSVMREDQPRLTRLVGLAGLFLVSLALIGLLLKVSGGRTWIGPVWTTLLIVTGLTTMLFHAVCEKEHQVRRLYGMFGYLWLVAGLVLPLFPVEGKIGAFFGPGLLCQGVGLLFLLAFVRNETEGSWRDASVRVLLGVGALLALAGLIGGSVKAEFLIPQGVLLAILGLAYLWAFVSVRGIGSDIGYRVGRAIGLVGALVFLVALGRSVFPQLFWSFGWVGPPRPEKYLTDSEKVPAGLLLMGLGALYMYVSVLLTSDRRLIVMHRRELASLFYSPIVYFVLLGITIGAYWFFLVFISRILDPQGQPAVEPIVSEYLIQWWPIICLIFFVPVLTMRMLSEEKRTGTLEVLLTAPVSEATTVLSKFFASLALFLLIWTPFGLFLAALRYWGGQPFDYRPLLSFSVALALTGSMFLSMGLFFSSLTRNQIISAVLTFAGMLTLTLIFFVKFMIQGRGPMGLPGAESIWVGVIKHVSYIDLWIDSVQGRLIPKFLFFPISATIVWLFMTVKVLEARRWS